MDITHLLFWYSFKICMENVPRKHAANQHIRYLLKTEKRMLIKEMQRKNYLYNMKVPSHEIYNS